MTQLNIPYTFQNQTTSDANQVDNNFNSISSWANGNVDDTNLKPNSVSKGIATEGVVPSQTKGIPYATDLYGSSNFVQSGISVTKDGTNANQINIASGVAQMIQTDGTLRRLTVSATNFRTSAANATYYLDLNPDGSWSFNTAHSTQTTYMNIATVTSDSSSNVSAITDNRVFGGPTTNTTPNSVPLRDANGNVSTKYPFAVMQNPNLLFNPSARFGLNGWSVSNSGGSSWSAQFGSNGEGGFFQTSTFTSGTPILTSANVPFAPNAELTLSAEMFSSGLTGDQVCDVQFLNASFGIISDLRITASNNTAWQKYSVSGTSPVNTAFLNVRCFCESSTCTGDVAWRKIKLETGSIATTFSDDNSLNVVQYSQSIPFVQTGQGNNVHVEDPAVQGTQISGDLASGSPGASTYTVTTSVKIRYVVIPGITVASYSGSTQPINGSITINGVTSPTWTNSTGNTNLAESWTCDLGAGNETTSLSITVNCSYSAGGNGRVDTGNIYQAKRLAVVGGAT